ncbi:MAG: carbohydrate-binding module family 20 domain-containing protein [Saprospiraceae bacterium]
MSLKKQFSKSKCKVTFTLPKNAVAGAKNVKVLGEFNEWNPENAVKMKSAKDEFKAVVELPVGKDYQFRYLVNDCIWENDWNADNYVSSPYDGIDNSVVFVRENMTTRKPVTKATATKRAATKKPAAKKTAVKKTATKVKATAKKVVAKKTTATKAKKDNLKKVEGIGPKIEKMFNEAGITTFSILSKTKVTALKAILKAAGPRYTMHNPTSWPAQAKMAANGDWDKLSKWQDELKGGK